MVLMRFSLFNFTSLEARLVALNNNYNFQETKDERTWRKPIREAFAKHIPLLHDVACNKQTGLPRSHVPHGYVTQHSMYNFIGSTPFPFSNHTPIRSWTIVFTKNLSRSLASNVPANWSISVYVRAYLYRIAAKTEGMVAREKGKQWAFVTRSWRECYVFHLNPCKCNRWF